MISKILIERFKNISRMELVLDKINILVGSNNSGKSSVLQAVQFFVSVAQTTGLEKMQGGKMIVCLRQFPRHN